MAPKVNNGVYLGRENGGECHNPGQNVVRLHVIQQIAQIISMRLWHRTLGF
jgi:hypothetical protein